jgi:hypothetical protein
MHKYTEGASLWCTQQLQGPTLEWIYTLACIHQSLEYDIVFSFAYPPFEGSYQLKYD